ncbi:hypothetical protein BCY88_19780 [Paraburkholderia fungorum]|uniref:Uncharacterized protein n=1 Tax=Paraburkholderia fungorum TaxID=134537 RepID=A0A3R7HR87_9BURK|nr:hypothetical protein BCY88_19780 [Paraburkholderia fungorum]
MDANADLSTDRDARTDDTSGISDVIDLIDLIDVSGERARRGDKKDSNCDKRETKREPRRLRDKEVGNVVNGQRNMPEILSPCG